MAYSDNMPLSCYVGVILTALVSRLLNWQNQQLGVGITSLMLGNLDNDHWKFHHSDHFYVLEEVGIAQQLMRIVPTTSYWKETHVMW